MSGPKVDEAKLVRQKQEQLERERQKRIKEIREAIEAYKDMCDNIRDFIQEVKASFLDEQHRLSEIPELTVHFKEVENIKKKTVSELQILLSTTPGNELSSIHEETDNLKKGMKNISEQYKQETCKLRIWVDEIIQKQKQLSDYDRFSDLLSGMEKSDVSEIEEMKDETYNDYVWEENLHVLKDRIERDKSKWFCEEGVMPYKDQILKLLGEVQSMITKQNEISITIVRQIGDAYEQLSWKIKEELKLYKDIYADYISECVPINITPKPLSAFSSVGALKKEICNIRQTAQKEMIRSYIQSQIDDVMSKFDYNVVNSTNLKPASKGILKLYKIEDDLGIQVFVSDQSRVTMNVVAIGSSEDISEEENEKLYDEQCAFCRQHPNIIKELETRGIVFNKLVHHTPDRKYNRKIKIEGSSLKKSTKKRSTKSVKMMEKKRGNK